MGNDIITFAATRVFFLTGNNGNELKLTYHFNAAGDSNYLTIAAGHII